MYCKLDSSAAATNWVQFIEYSGYACASCHHWHIVCQSFLHTKLYVEETGRSAGRINTRNISICVESPLAEMSFSYLTPRIYLQKCTDFWRQWYPTTAKGYCILLFLLLTFFYSSVYYFITRDSANIRKKFTMIILISHYCYYYVVGGISN